MSKYDQQQLKKQLIESIGNDKFSKQIERAFDISFIGHSDQYRESVHSASQPIPYIVHPLGVALLAIKYLEHVSLDDSLDDIISACLTHDILEDTSIDQYKLAKETSDRTAELVFCLTKPIFEPSMTREARNNLVNKHIVSGGLTTMFIKICDHSHNISRPNQTPINLLKKASKKGYGIYLNYFGDGLLPYSLKKEYISYLEKVTVFLNTHEKIEDSEQSRYTLEQVVDICERRVRGKILELHDIIDLLETVSGSILTRHLQFNDLISEISESLSPSSKNRWYERLKSQISSGWVELTKLPIQVRTELAFGCDYLFISFVDPELSKTDSIILFGYSDKNMPPWLNKNSLSFLYSYLITRLREQYSNHIKSISCTLNRLALNVDPKYVIKSSLNTSDLEEIRVWLDHSENIRIQLYRSLEYLLTNSYSELPYIESRLKPLSSILIKMENRNIKCYHEIDDLVGLRVICSNIEEIDNTVEDITKFIMDNYNLTTKDCKKGVSKNVLSTNLGYRAIHLQFQISISSTLPQTIPCEIQIRTLFQDSWAKYYRAVAYHINPLPKKTKKLFSELSEKTNEADELIKQIYRERK